MSAIFKREFKCFFNSPLGYVIFTVFSLFQGFYFFYLFSSGYGDIATLFSSMLTIVMFLCPIITMRLMCEEKRLKTEQALLTAPTSVWGIVLGKFLAAFAIYALCFALTLVNQFIFAIFVTPDWSVYIGNLLGMFLIGGALIAMGLFISSLTESQMVSAVVSFAAVLFVMMIDTFAGAFLSNHEKISAVVAKFSFYTRFDNFTKGILNISDILFFLSFAFIFLFFAAMRLLKRRWAGHDANFGSDKNFFAKLFSKDKRERKTWNKLRFRATVIVVVIALLAANVYMNVMATYYPLSVDITTNSEYTVNPENVKFLKGIDYPVELHIAFTEDYYKDGSYFSYYRGVNDTSGGKYYTQTIELLKQYSKYNKNIKVIYEDVFNDENISTLISEFTEKDLDVNYGDIMVKCYPDGAGKAAKYGVISFLDCYELEEDQEAQYQNTEGASTYNLKGNNIENAIANGVYKTCNLKTINIGLITTNSADTFVENFKETAGLNAFAFKTIPIITKEALDKYDVLMICAPGADYTQSECKMLSDWLDNNGEKGRSLYYFAASGSPSLKNLHGLLEEWGIGFDTGYKCYSKDRMYYSDAHTNLYLTTTATDYTSAVDSLSYSYIANDIIPIKALFEAEGTKKAEIVVTTEDNSTYKKPMGEPSWKPSGQGDQQGVIAVCSDQKEDNKSYVVACGSVDLLTTSAALEKSDNGNFRLLVSLLNATSRSDNDKYTMQTKSVSDSSGVFTKSTNAAQVVMIAFIFIGLIPISFIVIAIIVYFRRKNM